MVLVPHASDRLAHAIVAPIDSDTDPRTFALWASVSCMTERRLRDWCRAAHVEGRSALTFTRMLWAVALVSKHGWTFEEVLDTAEPRTLKRMLQSAGLSDRADLFDCSVDRFLTNQRIVGQTVLITRVRLLVKANP